MDGLRVIIQDVIIVVSNLVLKLTESSITFGVVISDSTFDFNTIESDLEYRDTTLKKMKDMQSLFHTSQIYKNLRTGSTSLHPLLQRFIHSHEVTFRFSVKLLSE